MRVEIYNRIAEIKGVLQALEDDLEENGPPIDEHYVESLAAMLRDEILFLRGIVKKLETH